MLGSNIFKQKYGDSKGSDFSVQIYPAANTVVVYGGDGSVEITPNPAPDYQN